MGERYSWVTSISSSPTRTVWPDGTSLPLSSAGRSTVQLHSSRGKSVFQYRRVSGTSDQNLEGDKTAVRPVKGSVSASR